LFFCVADQTKDIAHAKQATGLRLSYFPALEGLRLDTKTKNPYRDKSMQLDFVIT
jgi:hypothetical protein